MQSNPTVPDVVGVDGCREGWIAVFRNEGVLQYAIYRTFTELMVAFSRDARVAVDIPIGLPDRNMPSRACDLAARKVLGPRMSSVFAPPSRLATRQHEPSKARQVNIAEVGNSLSEQALGIARKIAEVDEWLIAHPDSSERVLEIHPEVCFWSLNRKRPMASPKKSATGCEERLRLLERWEPGAPELRHQVLKDRRRSQVQSDDVLDALAALVTLSAPPEMLRRLPDVVVRDALGLPMQMLYREI